MSVLLFLAKLLYKWILPLLQRSRNLALRRFFFHYFLQFILFTYTLIVIKWEFEKVSYEVCVCVIVFVRVFLCLLVKLGPLKEIHTDKRTDKVIC